MTPREEISRKSGGPGAAAVAPGKKAEGSAEVEAQGPVQMTGTAVLLK